jgi:sterol desaturase/sphingolipid hydroxylase (fatty acid hydroxylase superfamily)
MLGWIFSAAAGYLVFERIKPGWKLPAVRTWPLRATLVNLVQLGVVLLAGATWESWFSESSVFHLSEHVSPLTGGLIAYLIATFVFYWWHRWRHESDFLWRTLHQIHHSAQRIEVATSFYKHPLEMTINSVLGAALVYALLGLSPAGGAVYTACTALGEFFYHANLRTPGWVGWFFQRPEMHRIHHQYGRHRNNYGDLTCWDMLFGTFENPETVDVACGFDEDREERLLAMLAFRDAHAAPNG